MIEAIVDTNVFISAPLGGKTTRPIVDLFIERKFKLVTSKVLLGELSEVISYPKLSNQIDQKDAVELLSLIQSEAKIVTPEFKIENCRDPKDNIILECAIESKPNYIVTGDLDLLILNPYHGIPIISSSEFLKILHSKK